MEPTSDYESDSQNRLDSLSFSSLSLNSVSSQPSTKSLRPRSPRTIPARSAECELENQLEDSEYFSKRLNRTESLMEILNSSDPPTTDSVPIPSLKKKFSFKLKSRKGKGSNSSPSPRSSPNLDFINYSPDSSYSPAPIEPRPTFLDPFLESIKGQQTKRISAGRDSRDFSSSRSSSFSEEGSEAEGIRASILKLIIGYQPEMEMEAEEEFLKNDSEDFLVAGSGRGEQVHHSRSLALLNWVDDSVLVSIPVSSISSRRTSSKLPAHDLAEFIAELPLDTPPPTAQTTTFSPTSVLPIPIVKDSNTPESFQVFSPRCAITPAITQLEIGVAIGLEREEEVVSEGHSSGSDEIRARDILVATSPYLPFGRFEPEDFLTPDLSNNHRSNHIEPGYTDPIPERLIQSSTGTPALRFIGFSPRSPPRATLRSRTLSAPTHFSEKRSLGVKPIRPRPNSPPLSPIPKNLIDRISKISTAPPTPPTKPLPSIGVFHSNSIESLVESTSGPVPRNFTQLENEMEKLQKALTELSSLQLPLAPLDPTPSQLLEILSPTLLSLQTVSLQISNLLESVLPVKDSGFREGEWLRNRMARNESFATISEDGNYGTNFSTRWYGRYGSQ